MWMKFAHHGRLRACLAKMCECIRISSCRMIGMQTFSRKTHQMFNYFICWQSLLQCKATQNVASEL